MNILSLFVSDGKGKENPIQIAFNVLLVCAFLILVFWLSFLRIGLSLNFSFFVDFKIRVIDGFVMTVIISFTSMILSLIIGILSAMGEGSKVLFVKYLCNIYVKFIRGTPLIMQIYLFFYIIGTAWGIDNRYVAGVLILSIFEGAYISEIIRGSMISISSTQIEAAKAVGFNRGQTFKLVILPQLVARTLPALTGQFASIIKDSSLLSMIALIELTQTMREISSTNFKLFECYFTLGILYLILTLPISFASEALERRFNYEH